ncbi:hypothetical protein [Sphingomonas astaxanthinifaciens]|uniref:DUF4412 domain-containing protein n=1 Tax=Sphingomonas astaxanthinifaciens DSM 22298 TaxID=1123267 RepID=A0ABQ5Z4N4_9SPHN|nr:hypothetical protein [Sphingomonas astaxanthinifaciens]GLR46321.1 hypothetical protein GCM10007925_00320 [Sphingomonas astaxanthinifaciens DSM 22298]
MSLLLLLAAAVMPLSWQGRAVVHDDRRRIAITVRSRVEASGRVISESWPTAIGEAKGLRRFILEPTGTGTIERGGRREAAPADFVREEQGQFGFYQLMQQAAHQCAWSGARGIDDIDMGDPLGTHFACDKGFLTSAWNRVDRSGTPIRQQFRMRGWWRDGDAFFPKRLEIRRDGKPFFDLDVTRFRGR